MVGHPEPDVHDAARPWFIGIAASAGGIEALRILLPSLPPDLPAAVAIVLHRPPGHIGHLLKLFGSWTSLPVHLVAQGDAIKPGHVYLAHSDSHLTITPEGRFVSRNGTRIRFQRSSANPLFASAAEVFDGHAVGVVLSGRGSDATDGVQAVKEHGGIIIVQDPATLQHADMPTAAIGTGVVDYILPVEAIGPALNDLVHGHRLPAPAAVKPERRPVPTRARRPSAESTSSGTSS